jgi:hypothetical protein
VGKTRRYSKNAQRTTIYLEPAETVVLKQIEALRQHRSESRDSPSEIVADALWKWLTEVESIPREEIEKRFPTKDESKRSNVTKFRKKQTDRQ